jgi:putative transposase
MQRKIHSAEFKAKVALEAVKGQKTVNQIASEFGLHPNQVSTWKKHLLGALPEVFDKKFVKPDETHAALTDQLYEQIGRLKVELDWLKKKSAQLG